MAAQHNPDPFRADILDSADNPGTQGLRATQKASYIRIAGHPYDEDHISPAQRPQDQPHGAQARRAEDRTHLSCSAIRRPRPQ